MSSEQQYWFPAKTYGWGWGPPSTWQGWAVLLAYIGAETLAFFVVPPQRSPIYFFTCFAMLTSLFLWVCLKKGEPPKWRWGRQ